MSDENFASNASGVAMQYKLAGLNYKAATKEALFKKGLLRRIELICNIINITSSEPIDIIQDVSIKFTRNTIDNLQEQADLANKVANLISKESTIELLRDIIDPEQEKVRVKEEKEANMAQFEQQNEALDEDVNNRLTEQENNEEGDE
jgi:SPP1 family phage portal protein